MDRVLREAGVDQLLERLQRLEVGVAQDAVVGPRSRQPERLALARDELERQAGPLAQLLGRVARVTAQRLLHRQERQPPLLNRLPQLVEREPGVVQLVEQLEPRLACDAVESLEESLALEIDAGDR